MKKIILGHGQLGQAFAQQLPDAIVFDKQHLDFNNYEYFQKNLDSLIKDHDIESIINCSAYTNVDLAETERDIAMNINAHAVGELAKFCQTNKIKLIHFSTDFVFDGEKKSSYNENDATNPINHYGLSKLIGEENVLNNTDMAFVFRIAWSYSQNTKNNFPAKIIKNLMIKESLDIIDDQIGTPTDVDLIAKTVIKLLDNTNYGLYHLTHDSDFVSRYDLALFILDKMKNENINVVTKKINPVKSEAFVTPAKRPKNSMLSSEKARKILGIDLGSWKDNFKLTI